MTSGGHLLFLGVFLSTSDFLISPVMLLPVAFVRFTFY